MKNILVVALVAQTALFSPTHAEAQVRGRDVGVFALGALIGGIIGYNLRGDNRTVYDGAYNACMNGYNCGDAYRPQVMVLDNGNRVRPFFREGARGTLASRPGVRCRSFQVEFRDAQTGQIVGRDNRASCATPQGQWSEDPAVFGLPRNQPLMAQFVAEQDWRNRAWRSQRDIPAVLLPQAQPRPVIVQQPIYRPPQPQVYRPLPPPSGPIYGGAPGIVQPRPMPVAPMMVRPAAPVTLPRAQVAPMPPRPLPPPPPQRRGPPPPFAPYGMR